MTERAQTCKDCKGWGLRRNLISPITQCLTCNGAGVIQRTGPYRLQDGTWSDGVGRRWRVRSTGFHLQNPNRAHVYKGSREDLSGHRWRAFTSAEITYHPSQEAAMVAADRAARGVVSTPP